MKMFLRLALPLLVTVATMPAVALAYGNDSAQSGSQQGMRSGSAMTPHRWMMRGNMGSFQRMMRNPIEKSIAEIYLLPTLDARLHLSSTQVNNLKQLKQKYLDQQEALRRQIRDKRASFQAQFQSASPSTDQVKNAITSIANLRAQQQVAGYETAVQMRALLNQDQLGQLNAMTPAQMRTYMTAHMTMMEMSQMMRSMRGSMMGRYGMMQGAMSGGMGQHGMMHGSMMQSHQMSQRQRPGQ